MTETVSPRYSWNQAICEKDWIEQRGDWRPPTPEELERGMSPHDLILMGIQQPVRVATQDLVEVERCAWCGEPTIFGVYVRADPASVPFPQLKVD